MAGGGHAGGMAIRKYVGALKDSTTVSICKVHSEFKELDIAIVKATNHDEHPSKEKYITGIFYHLSAGRPRANVAYCTRALGRRLSKTHNWAVALKTLVVMHRALREIDSTFAEELISYERSNIHMLNMSHFEDNSSAEAWDYSDWVRNYALYLEEKLECFRELRYDVTKDASPVRDLGTVELLDQLPALQELLFRLLGCQPQGSSSYNIIIQQALSMVAPESVRIQTAINDGIQHLIDKFFEMKRDDAIRALDMYKKAIYQAEQLSEFYEVCKSIHIGRGERLLKIEQPPASFVATMEDYVSNAPLTSTFSRKQEVMAVEFNRESEVEEPTMLPPPPASGPTPPPKSEPEPVKVSSVTAAELIDLLGMNESTPDTSEIIDQRNAFALAIIQQDNAPKAPAPADTENVTNGWELALVSAPSSSRNAATSCKLAGGLDLLTLDSLYNEAHRQAQQNVSYNPWENISASGQVMQQTTNDPFYASTSIATSRNVQMAALAQQQQAFMLQQQHMMMMAGQQVHQQSSLNPFVDPYMYAGVHPYSAGMQLHAGNTYTGTGMI